MKKIKKSRLLVEVSNSFVRNVKLKVAIFMTIFRGKKSIYLIYPSIYPYREREKCWRRYIRIVSLCAYVYL